MAGDPTGSKVGSLCSFSLCHVVQLDFVSGGPIGCHKRGGMERDGKVQKYIGTNIGTDICDTYLLAGC